MTFAFTLKRNVLENIIIFFNRNELLIGFNSSFFYF